MGRCLAWFFKSRSHLAHLGSIIVLVVNSFFFLSYICMSMTLIKIIIIINLLFNSLIMSLFIYGVELWGGIYNKYINQIEKFISRAYRNGYIAEKFNFSEVISDGDRKLRTKIINNKDNALQELLSNKLNRPLRQRGHEFELPIIRTERYKRSFINRCLYKFV